jgi:hypothetical protein
MAVVITGNNTPTAGGVTYGDGTTYANTAAGTSGQVLTSAGASAPTWATVLSGFTLGTPVATTSGTSFEFASIPATVKQIVVMFNQVSLNGTNQIQIQLSASAVYKTSGYITVGAFMEPANPVTGIYETTVISLTGGSGAVAVYKLNGRLTLNLLNSSTNLWAYSSVIGVDSGGGLAAVMGGSVTMTNVLDKLKVFSSAGNTFDSGSINIAYI